MTGERVRELLPAIAAHGLSGTTPPLPSAPLDDATWASLLTGVTTARLQGQLAAAVSSGAVPTTPAQREEAAGAHVAAMAGVLSLERLLCQVDDAFEDAHVPMRVLKGPAVARLDYADPSLRAFGDIDLLVPADRLSAALSALEAMGCRRTVPELRPGFDRRFGKSVTLTTPGGFELDIHRTLALEPLGLGIRLDDLWAAGTLFTVAGRRFMALGPAQRLVHACYHAALDGKGSPLLPLRDVAEMTLKAEAAPTDVLRLAARWDGTAVVAAAVNRAWQTFQLGDVVHLSSWAKSYRPTPAEQRALRTHTAAGRRHAHKALVAVTHLPGLQDKAAYLRSLFFPSRAFLRQRSVGYAAWLRQGARSALTAGNRR